MLEIHSISIYRDEGGRAGITGLEEKGIFIWALRAERGRDRDWAFLSHPHERERVAGGGFASEKVAGGRGLVGRRAVGHGWKTKFGRCGTSKTPEMRDRANATARCGEEDGWMDGW